MKRWIALFLLIAACDVQREPAARASSPLDMTWIDLGHGTLRAENAEVVCYRRWQYQAESLWCHWKGDANAHK